MTPRAAGLVEASIRNAWVRCALVIAIAAGVTVRSARTEDGGPSSVRVFGVGITEQVLDLAALRAMPRSRARVSERGAPAGEVEGVALAAILERAGAPLGERLRGPALRLGVLVRAADDYRALFSLAEIDPKMNERVILLADRVDGADLPAREGPLRVIVPGEGRPARWVRQVVSFELICSGAVSPGDCSAPEAPHAPSDPAPSGAGR
jgi:hypothetical protein